MKWLLAGLVGFSTSVVSATILALIFGNLSSPLAAVSLLLGALSGALTFRQCRGLTFGFGPAELGFYTWLTVLAFGLFSLRAFVWLVFKSGSSVMVLSPNNLGDLPLHLAHIQYLAQGARFWPQNPIFTGARLHYPFGVDLFNALLVSLGAGVFDTLIIVGVLGSVATCASLLLWGRGFGLASFIFSGGLAGYQLFFTFVFSDYQKDLAWKNLFLSMFVTQRGLLYALPAGLVLLTSWWNRFFRRDGPVIPLWPQILIYSTMPLFHVHTFIFLSLLLAAWMFVVDKERRKGILTIVVCSLVPAAALMGFLTDFFRAASVVHWKPGWMQGGEGFLWFWIKNFGFWIPFVLGLAAVLVRRRKRAAQAVVLPALAGFFIFCFVMLAPWEWDNTKVLLWCYLSIAPFVWSELIERWPPLPQQLSCLALFFSGFVCVVGGVGPQHTGYEIFKLEEARFVQSAVRNIPVEERFAAYPIYNHPLFYSGRKLVLGYAGHIWSHGLKLEGRDEKLKSLMLGKGDWRQAARELGARYLYWGSREREEYKDSSKPWELSTKRVASGTWGSIYDLESHP